MVAGVMCRWTWSDRFATMCVQFQYSVFQNCLCRSLSIRHASISSTTHYHLYRVFHKSTVVSYMGTWAQSKRRRMVSCAYVLQKGPSNDGVCAVSTLCKCVKGNGDLFVLSWARVRRCALGMLLMCWLKVMWLVLVFFIFLVLRYM